MNIFCDRFCDWIYFAISSLYYFFSHDLLELFDIKLWFLIFNWKMRFPLIYQKWMLYLTRIHMHTHKSKNKNSWNVFLFAHKFSQIFIYFCYVFAATCYLPNSIFNKATYLFKNEVKWNSSGRINNSRAKLYAANAHLLHEIDTFKNTFIYSL